MSKAGWNCKVKFPVKSITKERMIDVNGADATGDGSKTTFWTRNFPVVDSAGNPTDDETLVTVYLDDVAQGPTTFTLTGAEGKIVFGTAPAVGKVITITFNYSKTVGYGQATGIDYDGKTTPVKELGSRLPVELKDGLVDIGLTIRRCWLDRDFLGKSWHPKSSPEFDVDVMPDGIGSGKPYIRLTGKFSSWHMDLPLDGILMEDQKLVGRLIAIGSQA